MNSVRFELAKLIDCCFSSVSICKATWHSAFRAVFKDSRQRPRIFVFSNLFICTVNLLIFGLNMKNPIGIMNYGEYGKTYRWLFIAVTVTGWVNAVGLIYAFKQRKAVLCQLWCINETIIIVIYLVLTLSESVHIYKSGICLLIIGTIIKLYGLWVIYYFSLEIKHSPDFQQSRRITKEEDGCNIKYFVASAPKRAVTRRETDVTSIASSPSRQVQNDDEDDNDGNTECNDSVLDDNSPTGESFKFFGIENYGLEKEPQYSEIMIHGQHNISENVSNLTPELPCSSKDNIIISDLMCGGSSTLNLESER